MANWVHILLREQKSKVIIKTKSKVIIKTKSNYIKQKETPTKTKTENKKCWGKYGEIETSVHYW